MTFRKGSEDTRCKRFFRFTTLTAEGHGGRIPLSPPIKSLASVPSFFCIAHASLRSLVRDLQRRQIRWGSSLHSSHAMHRSGVRCLSVAKKFAEAPVYGKRQYPLISTKRWLGIKSHKKRFDKFGQAFFFARFAYPLQP